MPFIRCAAGGNWSLTQWHCLTISDRLTPPGFDGLTVHRTVRGTREGVGEGHGVGALEPRDLRADEVADLRARVAVGRSYLDDRLDRFAPPYVGNAVDADAADAVHLE